MNTITIYHKDYCPYCKQAKKTLEAYGLKYTAIEVTDKPAEFANMVSRSGGRKTVPQIFFDDQHIGGLDDLQQHIKCNSGIRINASRLITICG